jgi:hypothetical protein
VRPSAGRGWGDAAGAWLFVALLGAGCAFVASLIAVDSVDYSKDAGPAIAALTRLDLHGFFAYEPQMGALTLLLRWPFAALAPGTAQLDQYRFGLFAGLFAAALVGLVLAREMHRRGRGPVAVGLVLGLWFLNPAPLQAINIGHPEEILGGALAILAVPTASRGSSGAAGAALGLALATKQWALAAVPSTLLASRRPIRTGAFALLIWLPLELPLIIGNFDAYTRVGRFGVVVGGPRGLWWLPAEVLPADVIVAVARPLVLVAAFAVALVVARRGGGRTLEGQLALLGLTLLLRVLLDPTGNMYFAAPFLMALLAFEGIATTRPPIVSIAAIVMVTLTFRGGSVTTANLIYTAWALPLAAFLWRRATQASPVAAVRR